LRLCDGGSAARGPVFSMYDLANYMGGYYTEGE
jgi:hypothetical protein